MTELLHPVHTDSASTAAPDVLDAPGNVLLLAASATDLRSPEVGVARHERDMGMLDDALTAVDLAALPTRQLRVMVNQVYKLMDTYYPPAGALERYEMIVEELQDRAQRAARRGNDSGTGFVDRFKETFRDNPLYCRFELFIDGILAGYVKYTMAGAQIVLLDGVEQPGFYGPGIDAALMRHVVLNAHKRRLSLVAQCPMALTFLADNPQYQALTGLRARTER